MPTHTLLPLIATSICAPALLAQQAIEISADGRDSVIRHDQSNQAPYRGSGVPFALTPDQTVELRRQIGGVQIADMNNDGFNDLVAVCYISNSFPPYEDWHDMIFFGNGNGIETTPGWISDIQTHTGDVQIGDLDSNGYLDLVTIHGSLRRDSVRAYFGSADGLPTVPEYVSQTSVSNWATSGVLADMDNDNDLDLVTTNQGVAPNPFRPMLMFDNTGATLTTSSIWQSDESSIQNGIDARDITGDGYPELAVAKWVNFTSGIYYNTTGTPDTFQGLYAIGTDGDKGAAFTDLENDGLYEVGFGGDPSQVYSNIHGALLPIYASDPPFSGPQEIKFFDVDNDGDEDMGEVHFSDGRTHIYLNRDGVLDEQPTWTYDASEVGNSLAFGDLNNDGAPDLAIGYSGSTSIRVFFGEAPSCAPDLNGDGDLNFFDVSAFLNAFGKEDPSADFEADGQFNFFDVSVFLQLFSQGCP
jgi:FG-GAP-like repeat